jgi:hypothetical protein
MPKHSKKNNFKDIFFKKSVIIALVFGLAFGGIGGYTIKQSHAASYDAICLYYNTKECIVDNGKGSQASLSSGSRSYWAAREGDYGVMLQDERGDCLMAPSSEHGGVITGGACSASNRYDNWVVTSYAPSVVRMYNSGLGSNSYLGAYDDVSGYTIDAIAPHSGYWWGWSDPAL